MRRRLAAVASSVVAATLVLSACGSAAPPDAYDLISASATTAWDPIQINVGLTAKDGKTTVAIPPSAIAMVIDTAGTKTAIHVALPADSLGLPPGAVDQLGFGGNSIDFDVVFDGQKLYARSALLGPSLRMILGPSGKLPPGNLAGWLAFGTAEEFAALSNLMGTAPGLPSAAPSAGSSASPKATLEAAGITLTIAGTEKHGGVDATHIAIAVDSAKLIASPLFDAATRAQLGQLGLSVQKYAFSGDVWLDPVANRVVEVDIHVASVAKPEEVADLTISFHDPDGTVSLSAPPSSVDIPIGTLIGEMMKLLGKGLES